MALVSIIWFILTVWLAETIQIKHVLMKSEKERILNDNLTFQFYQLIERLDLIQRFKLTKFTLIEKDHLGDRSPEKDCC